MSQNQDSEVSNPAANTTAKTHKKKAHIHKQNKSSKKSNVFTTSNYRTERCQFFNKGHCTKGNDCTYRHDFIPDTARKICKFFLSGACTKENCPYSHNTKTYPCLFYHVDKSCQLGSHCRFSHSPIPEDFREQYLRDHKEHIIKLYKEGKLDDQSMIEPFRDQLPKSEPVLPPIAPEVSKIVPKQDPRLKIRKQLAQTPKVKKQEQKEDIILTNMKEEEGIDARFERYVKDMMFSYY